jgi:hypothetical protein
VDSPLNPEHPASTEPLVRFPVGHYSSPMYEAEGTLMQLDYDPVALSTGEQARLTGSQTRKAAR